jgi:hypothetical protein
MWAAVLAAILCSGAPAARAASLHVRAASQPVRALLTEAAGSPTISALLRRLEASDQVVYIVYTDSPEIPTARTKLMAAAPGIRFLRIDLNARLAPWDRLPLLAHELQHAVELAEAPQVRSDADLRQLYERIGVSSGVDRFETAAARAVERRVRSETTVRMTRREPTPKA